MTKCTERVEKTDNRGDTKTVYAEVKRLSGLVSRGVNTRSTAEYQEPGVAEEKKNEYTEELVSKNDTDNRSREKQDLASKKGYRYNVKSEDLVDTRRNETAEYTRNVKTLELAVSD